MGRGFWLGIVCGLAVVLLLRQAGEPHGRSDPRRAGRSIGVAVRPLRWQALTGGR